VPTLNVEVPLLTRAALVVATVVLLCAGCGGSSASTTTLPHEAFIAKLDPLCASFTPATASEMASVKQKLAAHDLKGAGDLLASRLVPSMRRIEQQLAAIRPDAQDITTFTAYKRDIGRFTAIVQQVATAMQTGNAAGLPHLLALMTREQARGDRDVTDLGTNNC
jgi:hypothetical protein